ncbi:MAG: HAD hydrolase-like protein [Chloroflexi bacterium]|nr:HAD hydrolase-like protein [Chloroflexota bacterium]
MDTARAGSRSMAIAFYELFGITDAFNGIPFAGRTDLAIVKDAIALHGISDGDRVIAQLKEAYFIHLGRLLYEASGRVLPGVMDLLELLSSHKHAYLGLATGNFRRSGMMKLERYELAGYFKEGGFGDETIVRAEVVAEAIRRCQEAASVVFALEDIYVIGDTAHDIESGKANGARTIGVATGPSSTEQLAQHQPTLVFQDLQAALPFFGSLLEPAAEPSSRS